MKRLILLTFAALSVCFVRAQTADVASETFHADTIAVKDHGLVIFDKIPDSYNPAEPLQLYHDGDWYPDGKYPVYLLCQHATNLK